MSRFRKIYKKLWSDRDFCSLNETEKLLYLYLLTGKETTLIPGIVDSLETNLADRLGKDLKTFREAFRNLSRVSLARADWSVGIVFLPRAIEDNCPASTNVILSWKNTWEELPDCRLKDEIFQELTEALGKVSKSFREAFQNLRLKERVERREEKGERRKDINARVEDSAGRNIFPEEKVSGRVIPGEGKSKPPEEPLKKKKFPKLSPEKNKKPGFDLKRVEAAQAEALQKPKAPKPELKQPAEVPAKGESARVMFFSPSANPQEILADLDGAQGLKVANQLKKQLREIVVEAYRAEKVQATGNGFTVVEAKGLAAAERIGRACIGHGLKPLDFISYWRDPSNNFTKMKFPTLSFMAAEPNLEQAANSIKPAQPGKSKVSAPNRDGHLSKRKEAGFSFDADDLHPLLRETLTKAGFDVSKKTDRALMTIQVAAEELADRGDPEVVGFATEEMEAQATAVVGLFQKENPR